MLAFPAGHVQCKCARVVPYAQCLLPKRHNMLQRTGVLRIGRHLCFRDRALQYNISDNGDPRDGYRAGHGAANNGEDDIGVDAGLPANGSRTLSIPWGVLPQPDNVLQCPCVLRANFNLCQQCMRANDDNSCNDNRGISETNDLDYAAPSQERKRACRGASYL
jgi:hypothetical protein